MICDGLAGLVLLAHQHDQLTPTISSLINWSHQHVQLVAQPATLSKTIKNQLRPATSIRWCLAVIFSREVNDIYVKFKWISCHLIKHTNIDLTCQSFLWFCLDLCRISKNVRLSIRSLKVDSSELAACIEFNMYDVPRLIS